MKTTHQLSFIVALLCITSTGMVFAKDDDNRNGSCSASNNVCNSLRGDLFGVCNAYCYAMNCANTADKRHKENKRNCQKKQEQWNKLVHNDPNLPLPCNASPAISVTKSVVGADSNGDLPATTTDIQFSIKITNSGNVELKSIVLSDLVGSSQLQFTCSPPLANLTLLVNNSVDCTSNPGQLPAHPGDSGSNVASVSAKDAYGAAVPAVESNPAAYAVLAQASGCPCEAYWVSIGHAYPSGPNPLGNPSGFCSVDSNSATVVADAGPDPLYFRYSWGIDINSPLLGQTLPPDQVNCSFAKAGQALDSFKSVVTITGTQADAINACKSLFNATPPAVGSYTPCP